MNDGKTYIKQIILIKTTNTRLTFRMVGEVFTVTFGSSILDGHAQALAFRKMLRSYPNENPMDWDIKEIIYADN